MKEFFFKIIFLLAGKFLKSWDNTARKRHKSLDTQIEQPKFKWIPELSKLSQQTQDRAKADLHFFFTPRVSGWCKSSQQKYPNPQNSSPPVKMNTRPTEN